MKIAPGADLKCNSQETMNKRENDIDREGKMHIEMKTMGLGE